MDNPQHSLDAPQLLACNPPPWDVWPCKDRLGNITSYDVCLQSEPDMIGVAVVASVYSGEEIARLIAAAPEMFEAIAAFVERWNGGSRADTDYVGDLMVRAHSKARGSNDTQP